LYYQTRPNDTEKYTTQ